jgi:RNA polymerase sigma factor (sigma-70 family)
VTLGDEAMVETPETTRETNELHVRSAVVTEHDLEAWFVSEVLPLEPALMQFLRHSWRYPADVSDLRQDVYVRLYEAAKTQIPDTVKPLLFAIARNLLIDRFRRERIIPIDGVADLAEIEVASDAPLPDRSIIARDELRHLQAALDKLPPRCREAVVLKQIEGMSRREIAVRMGISEDTVRTHLRDGVRQLIDILHDHPQASI